MYTTRLSTQYNSLFTRNLHVHMTSLDGLRRNYHKSSERGLNIDYEQGEDDHRLENCGMFTGGSDHRMSRTTCHPCMDFSRQTEGR